MVELFSDKGLRIPVVHETDVARRIDAFDNILARLELSLGAGDPHVQLEELERERANVIFHRVTLDRRLGSVEMVEQVSLGEEAKPSLFDQLEHV